MSAPKPKPREALIKALARCVESLSLFALIDTGGAIREAVETEPRVWDFLDKQTTAALEHGLGLTRP